VVAGSRLGCEWFSIPEFGVDWLRGKIDTGGRSSALHAERVKFFQKEGTEWVGFETIDGLRCEAEVICRNESSSCFIEISVETLRDETMDLLVELSDRSEKKYPLTLGRRELSRFLVDSSERYLFGKV